MPYIGVSPPSAPLTSSDITDNIITEAKMADDAISLTELKAGTDGEVISWDASGNPVAIGAGTSGHFLKSQGAGSQPVFAAAGGGTWTLIETQTASSDATIDFTTLSADYRDFKVIGSGISCGTNAVDPWIRYRVSGSWVTSGTTYDWACWGWDITNSGGSSGGDGNSAGWGDKTAAYIRLISPYEGAATSGLGSTAGYTLGFDYTVFDVHSSNRTQSIFGAALTLGGGSPSIGALQYSSGGGTYSTITAIDGVRFQFSSGNVAAGMISFYGRKTS